MTIRNKIAFHLVKSGLSEDEAVKYVSIYEAGGEIKDLKGKWDDDESTLTLRELAMLFLVVVYATIKSIEETAPNHPALERLKLI